ncbi:hypothetical protein V8E51_015982 [Hyaloscypha variabilis]
MNPTTHGPKARRRDRSDSSASAKGREICSILVQFMAEDDADERIGYRVGGIAVLGTSRTRGEWWCKKWEAIEIECWHRRIEHRREKQGRARGARMGKVVRRDEKQKRSAEQRYGLGRQTRPTNSISSSTTTTSSAVQHQGAAGMRPDPNLNANPSRSKHSHSPRAMAAKLEDPRPATSSNEPMQQQWQMGPETRWQRSGGLVRAWDWAGNDSRRAAGTGSGDAQIETVGAGTGAGTSTGTKRGALCSHLRELQQRDAWQ